MWYVDVICERCCSCLLAFINVSVRARRVFILRQYLPVFKPLLVTVDSLLRTQTGQDNRDITDDAGFLHPRDAMPQNRCGDSPPLGRTGADANATQPRSRAMFGTTLCATDASLVVEAVTRRVIDS